MMSRIKRILCLVMFLSLGFPLIYLYYFLFPPRVIDPQKALISLGKDIKQKAQEQKLSGYIAPVEKIIGAPDESISNMKDDLTLLISTFTGCKTLAAEETRQRIKQKEDEFIKRWESIIGPETIEKLILQEAYVAKNLKYNVDAKCEIAPGANENYYLSLQILQRGTKLAVINSKVEFTHPLYYSKYIKRKNAIAFGTYISGGVFSSAFLFFVISRLILILKRRKLEKFIPEAMQKCQDYIDKGSYTAADSLIREFLNYFPENGDFIAIQRRLMVITKNNPSRAEEAYIRYINLATKLKQGVFLTDEEYEDFKNLPKFLELPEITETIAKYQKIIEIYEIYKKVKVKQEEIRGLISSGELSKAQEEVDSLYKDDYWIKYKSHISEIQKLPLPAPDNFNSMIRQQDILQIEKLELNFDSIREEIEKKHKASKENFNKSKEYISKGEISQAEKLLREVAKTNKDLKAEAETILSNIEKSRSVEKLLLRPEQIGKEVLIFKKDIITFFKKNQLEPDIDINDPRISRDHHLKLCILENRVIAEDENSRNGTYHRGSKIPRAEIEDGDIIDLAHSYKMIVHICRGREIVKSTLIQGTIPSEMKIDAREIAEQQKISGLFIEADDKNIIIVLPAKDGMVEGVPIAFKSIGIVYEKSGDSLICLKDGVVILKTPETSQILYPDEVINQHGVRYKVSEV